MPTTFCGRLLAVAMSRIGSADVLVAMMHLSETTSSSSLHHLVLEREVLEDGLDDEAGALEVRAPQLAVAGQRVHARLRALGLGLRHLALLDARGQVAGDLREPAVEARLLGVLEQHRVALGDADLRDAGAHQAGADDADRVDARHQRLDVSAWRSGSS
jgi:hypothetical protein